MTSANTSKPLWWGQYTLKEQEEQQWQIGPLTMMIRYHQAEWHLGYQHEAETEDLAERQTLPPTSLQQLQHYHRYIFSDSSGQLSITPLLADRPVIARPQSPFNLPAGEEIMLYVSSPLWLKLCVGASEKVMTEIGIQRPSDTWFGPSTMEGELCYASTTHCRTQLSELPERPHRAITPLRIENRADSTLLIDRLSLPAPMLPLYATQGQQLWTAGITLTREKDGDMAELKIDNEPPERQAELISKARMTANKGALIRAFNAVFS